MPTDPLKDLSKTTKGSSTTSKESPLIQDQISALEDQVKFLQKTVDALQSTQKLIGTTTQFSDDFEKEVWKAVLIGATSALFDPNRIPLDNRPNALEKYLHRALTIAETAATTSRKYRKFLDAKDKELLKTEALDPLKDMLGPEDED